MKLDKIQIGFTAIFFIIGLIYSIEAAIVMALLGFFITSMVNWILD